MKQKIVSARKKAMVIMISLLFVLPVGEVFAMEASKNETGAGSYSDEWVFTDGFWYFYDADGAMAVGWRQVRDHWYYYKSSGMMAVNEWIVSGAHSYYMTADGSMKTGWQKWQGDWYYLHDDSGELFTNMVTPDGEKVDAEGIWIP